MTICLLEVCKARDTKTKQNKKPNSSPGWTASGLSPCGPGRLTWSLSAAPQDPRPHCLSLDQGQVLRHLRGGSQLPPPSPDLSSEWCLQKALPGSQRRCGPRPACSCLGLRSGTSRMSALRGQGPVCHRLGLAGAWNPEPVPVPEDFTGGKALPCR